MPKPTTRTRLAATVAIALAIAASNLLLIEASLRVHASPSAKQQQQHKSKLLVKAIDKTKEISKMATVKTKEISRKATDKTIEISRRATDKTIEISRKATDKTKIFSRKATIIMTRYPKAPSFVTTTFMKPQLSQQQQPEQQPSESVASSTTSAATSTVESPINTNNNNNNTTATASTEQQENESPDLSSFLPTNLQNAYANVDTDFDPIVEFTTRTSPPTGIYRNKPLLRGQFHKWGAILYPPLLGLPLCIRASSNKQLLQASFLYNFSVESIMAVSATLHTWRWQTEKNHQNARKLDFTAIFVGIACSYSSLGRLTMGHHPWWNSIEKLVWACACIGTLTKWKIPDCPHWVNGLVFIGQGWATLPVLPEFFRSASSRVAVSLVLGGACVTLGALAYAFQWTPYKKQQEHLQPYEIIFGPHELFHVGSLFMVVFFWYTMWTRVGELSL